MANHQIPKPRLFISHATSDGEFARAVQYEIEKVFADGVNVFCTSSLGAIEAGEDWTNTIEKRLSETQAVIVLITPTSINKPWVWFEVGATWLKTKQGECKIYPLCVSEIQLSELPPPLNRLQALSLGKASDLKLLFEALIKQFGFGKITSFKSTNITKRIPKYKDVKIAEIDANSKEIYVGPYLGYSDEELEEVIDAKIFAPEHSEPFNILTAGKEDLIRNGKLLHFREIDKGLKLPMGTSKRILIKVARRNDLEPVLITDNIIRFKPQTQSLRRGVLR